MKTEKNIYIPCFAIFLFFSRVLVFNKTFGFNLVSTTSNNNSYKLFVTNHKRTTKRSNTILFFAKKSGTKKKKPSDKTITLNRIAYRNYEILDTMEAGIVLTGTEVKSIRDGKLNIRDGFIKTTKNGRTCTLYNTHIGKCTQVGSFYQHEEKRPRTLLVHKEEARKLMKQTEQDGMTIIPIKAYFNEQNKVKLQIAVCRGKNVRDKRADIKERDAKRETSRIVKNFRVV